MIYRTYEHYSMESHDINKLNDSSISADIKECFICFDHETINTKIMKLKDVDVINYYKKCKCDGWVHIHCLETWVHLQEKCPICRESIMKKKHPLIYVVHFVFIDVHSVLLFMFYKCIQIMFIVIKIICFIYFLYFFYHLNSILQIKTKTKYYYSDNTYSDNTINDF